MKEKIKFWVAVACVVLAVAGVLTIRVEGWWLAAAGVLALLIGSIYFQIAERRRSKAGFWLTAGLVEAALVSLPVLIFLDAMVLESGLPEWTGPALALAAIVVSVVVIVVRLVEKSVSWRVIPVGFSLLMIFMPWISFRNFVASIDLPELTIAVAGFALAMPMLNVILEKRHRTVNRWMSAGCLLLLLAVNAMVAYTCDIRYTFMVRSPQWYFALNVLLFLMLNYEAGAIVVEGCSKERSKGFWRLAAVAAVASLAVVACTTYSDCVVDLSLWDWGHKSFGFWARKVCQTVGTGGALYYVMEWIYAGVKRRGPLGRGRKTGLALAAIVAATVMTVAATLPNLLGSPEEIDRKTYEKYEQKYGRKDRPLDRVDEEADSEEAADEEEGEYENTGNAKTE